jgi:hypothetical protein
MSLGELEFSENPALEYYAYIGIITGADVYAPIPVKYGIQYEPWLDGTVDSVFVDLLEDEDSGYDMEDVDGGKARIMVKKMPQPCSAINIIGRMPTGSHFSVLSPQYDIKITRLGDGFKVDSVRDAWGVAMVARWLGYDTELEYRGKTKVMSYAANSDSIAMMPFSVKGPDVLDVVVKSFSNRQKVFTPLPALDGKENIWRVSVSVKATYAIESLSRRNKITMRGTFYRPRKEDKGRINRVLAKYVDYVPITIKVESRGDPKQWGFHMVTPVPPGDNLRPEPPMPKSAAVESIREEEPPDLEA